MVLTIKHLKAFALKTPPKGIKIGLLFWTQTLTPHLSDIKKDNKLLPPKQTEKIVEISNSLIRNYGKKFFF